MLKKLESTNLSQIVQIIINIEYFESTCPDFEMLLMETRSFHRSGRIHLKATQTFKETRRKAEKRIFELVNSKLDEFLQLSEYDWYDEMKIFDEFVCSLFDNQGNDREPTASQSAFARPCHFPHQRDKRCTAQLA